ncbi:enoyl-CoA hydratase/isomerase family protein [Haliangium sp.]|uniref:enoyl-CoA hydratase/isomerase family protein n=1 Tax=Haliangium sp. TaxID=2663208 RepID=UPI003D0FDDB4
MSSETPPPSYATPSYATIAYDDEVPVARITLARPDKRNPIAPLTVGELVHALEAVRENEAARAVVITGSGKAFSAGGDLSSITGGVTRASIGPRSLVDLFPVMHGLGKPIIAMVNGPALGGGLGLMAACDLVVASEAATFGLPEIKVGLWPMMVMAEIVRNIGRKQTLELMLTGKRVSAREAQALGLVNRVVAAEELEPETMALANEVASHSPATVALGLRAFYDSQDMDIGAALPYLEAELGKVLALEDAAEGIRAFLQKRAPNWRGR